MILLYALVYLAAQTAVIYFGIKLGRRISAFLWEYFSK